MEKFWRNVKILFPNYKIYKMFGNNTQNNNLFKDSRSISQNERQIEDYLLPSDDD